MSDIIDPYEVKKKPLNPYPTVGKSMSGNMKTPTHTLSSPAGSIFINGTSYSGTDIKVLAHIYEPGAAGLYRRKALVNEIKLAENDLLTQRGQLASLKSKLETVHKGTPEEEKISKQLTKQTDKVYSLDNLLDAMKTEMRSSEVSAMGGQPTGVGAVKPLGEIQTLSLSVMRDKRDVRALGHVGVKARTRGPRVIAGSMVFTVFLSHVFMELMSLHPSEFDGVKFTPAMADQMPPMDITIVFANEYGHTSRMAIYGVDLNTEGMVFSIEDIFTEQTFNFSARDYDPMRSVAERKIDEQYKMNNEWVGKRASDLIFEKDFQDIKNELDPFWRFQNRQDPYI